MSCAGSDAVLWERDIEDNIRLKGTLRIAVLSTPDLRGREGALMQQHFVKFQCCRQTAQTPYFHRFQDLSRRERVVELKVDGTDHFLKVSVHTGNEYNPLLPTLLNGNMEIPLHTVVEARMIETQMYYKHRFHRLLDKSLKIFCEFVPDHGADDDDEPADGKLKDSPQHPLEAWHRGAYDDVLDGWLHGRVKWVDSYFWDLWIFIANEHLFFGMFFAHFWNPLTIRSRIFVWFAVCMTNVFTLGVEFWTSCRIPECDTGAGCVSANPPNDDYNECTYEGSTYYCKQDECASNSIVEGYGLSLAFAAVAFFLTKFIIWSAACSCAKHMQHDWKRTTLETCGKASAGIFGFAAFLSMIIGIVLAATAYDRTNRPDGGEWFLSYLLQILQTIVVDLIFCFLQFNVYNCCSDFEELAIVEDEQYFREHELHGIEIHASKKAEKKTPHPLAEEKKAAGDAKAGDEQQQQKKKKKHRHHRHENALQRSLHRMADDPIQNRAAKPTINTDHKTDDVEIKKMRVKVPARCRPGGLLKVHTPEGPAILVRLPENVEPGVTELTIPYKIHKQED